MATSNTSTFNLTVDEIVTEAYEHLGIATPTGGDLKTARRSLGLLLQEFANRNLFAYTLEKVTLSVLQNDGVYTLPADTIDIRTVTIASGGSDIELTRYAYPDYAVIANKTSTGRPIVYTVDRQRDDVTLRLWPVPDANYTMSYEKIRKIQDVGEYTMTIDVPQRLLPALVAGLAYKLALKKPKMAGDTLPILKGEYEQQFSLAIEGDRDRTSTFIKLKQRRR